MAKPKSFENMSHSEIAVDILAGHFGRPKAEVSKWTIVDKFAEAFAAVEARGAKKAPGGDLLARLMETSTEAPATEKGKKQPVKVADSVIKPEQSIGDVGTAVAGDGATEKKRTGTFGTVN